MIKVLKDRFKKFIAVVLLISSIASLFSGCGTLKPDDGVLNILCTVFPVYDWVRQITKDADNIEVELLVDTGADLHSYQATAADIVKIASCDLFIYVGGASDGWVEEALKSAPAVDRSVLKLMDFMSDDSKICSNVGYADEHGHEESHVHSNDAEYDEHIWLSLFAADSLCDVIYEKIFEIDPMFRENCLLNAIEYREELRMLLAEYSGMFDDLPNNTLVFGGRFPFAYLLKDYDLLHYSAFEGCSAESEASFDTVVFLSRKIDELGVPYILTVKGDSNALAKTVIANTKDKTQQIIELDSMQSVTRKDIENGATYFDIMKANLDAIKIALDY